jgi:hypothetical protein
MSGSSSCALPRARRGGAEYRRAYLQLSQIAETEGVALWDLARLAQIATDRLSP